MLDAAGESTFEIWLARLELIAIDGDGLLVLTGPDATLGWVQKRFGGLISRCCEQVGCGVRFASAQELLAIKSGPLGCPIADVGEQPTMNRRVS